MCECAMVYLLLRLCLTKLTTMMVMMVMTETYKKFARIYLFCFFFFAKFFLISVWNNYERVWARDCTPTTDWIRTCECLYILCWLRALYHTRIIVWTPHSVAFNNKRRRKKMIRPVYVRHTKSTKEKILWLITINWHILFSATDWFIYSFFFVYCHKSETKDKKELQKWFWYFRVFFPGRVMEGF